MEVETIKSDVEMSWENVRLSEITFNLDNKRKPLNEIERNKISKLQLYPYIGANNIMGYVDEYLFDEEIICVAEDGGSWGQNEKCCVFINQKCWVNNHAHVLKSNGRADLKFVMYYLNSTDLNSYITGSTRGKLTKSSLDSIPIPLPPLSTQKRIAEILDAADALRRKDQELLKKYDELAQGIFIDMFGDPVKNEKGWEVRKLQDVCKQIFGGGTPSKSKPEYYLGAIPWVTPKDMKSDIIIDSIDHINEEAVKNSSTKLVPRNSVLMVIRSGILKHTLPVAINDTIVSMNQDMKAFIPNTDLTNAIFLKYFFHRVSNFLLSKVRAVTADNIEFEQIKNMLFICPPIHLQNEFSGRVSIVQKQFATSLDLSKYTESLFDTLIQKAFKGELVK